MVDNLKLLLTNSGNFFSIRGKSYFDSLSTPQKKHLNCLYEECILVRFFTVSTLMVLLGFWFMSHLWLCPSYVVINFWSVISLHLKFDSDAVFMLLLYEFPLNFQVYLNFRYFLTNKWVIKNQLHNIYLASMTHITPFHAYRRNNTKQEMSEWFIISLWFNMFHQWHVYK